MKFSLQKKLNQVGMLSLHVIVPAIIAIAAVAGVGAYVVSKSGAAPGPAVSGSYNAQCGTLYRNSYVYNMNFQAARDSDSVRNIARQLCVQGFLSSSVAKAANKSGNWSASIQLGVKKLQLSRAALKGDADGIPGPKTVCALYLVPQGFANNSCAVSF
jgi:hypothetical protein